MIPVMVALQHMLFPLKKEEGVLFLAMADPTDTEIVEKIASIDNLRILPFVATKHEIRLAICRHYLNKELTKATDRTVLIADPDRSICTQAAEALAKDHYQVLTALDGMDAFRKIIAETPHVIIADSRLPKLDACGLLGSLKNIPEVQYVPMIIIGENGQGGQGEFRSFAAGAFDFILKPVTEQALRARVKRAFHFYDHQYRLF
jgi:PleD family two-component response regulator